MINRIVPNIIPLFSLFDWFSTANSETMKPFKRGPCQTKKPPSFPLRVLETTQGVACADEENGKLQRGSIAICNPKMAFAAILRIVGVC